MNRRVERICSDTTPGRSGDGHVSSASLPVLLRTPDVDLQYAREREKKRAAERDHPNLSTVAQFFRMTRSFSIGKEISTSRRRQQEHPIVACEMPSTSFGFAMIHEQPRAAKEGRYWNLSPVRTSLTKHQNAYTVPRQL
jgi:hypothetical protein